MEELRKQIIVLQNKIQKQIKYINSGGCIQFAYYFSKRLTELGIDHKIVFGNRQPIDVRYDYFDPVSHVMIYIKGIGYIDGEDTQESIKNDYNYLRHCNVSNTKLDRFRKEFIWNNTYDKRQNRKVENLINKYITNDQFNGGTIHSIHQKWRNCFGR